MSTPIEAVRRAIKKAGSRAELARKLGVSRQTIHHWEDGRPVPPKRCVLIETVFGIPRELFRPDIYGRPTHRVSSARAA